jgi:hypothetical protein
MTSSLPRLDFGVLAACCLSTVTLVTWKIKYLIPSSKINSFVYGKYC